MSVDPAALPADYDYLLTEIGRSHKQAYVLMMELRVAARAIVRLQKQVAALRGKRPIAKKTKRR